MTVSAETPWDEDPGWLGVALWHVVLPLLLAGVMSVSIPPFNFAAFALWIVFLARTVRGQLRRNRSRLAVASVTLQLAGVAAIVTAAHMAPVKTTDRFLDRTITIPKSRMTLAELEGEPDGPRPDWRPFAVSVVVPASERNHVIAFAGTTLTLHEFVDAVESQSTLRHRFAHCGNGWTVLWGGDCSFGLCLCRPSDR